MISNSCLADYKCLSVYSEVDCKGKERKFDMNVFHEKGMEGKRLGCDQIGFLAYSLRVRNDCREGAKMGMGSV